MILQGKKASKKAPPGNMLENTDEKSQVRVGNLKFRCEAPNSNFIIKTKNTLTNIYVKYILSTDRQKSM